jgi:hypothetical protein
VICDGCAGREGGSRPPAAETAHAAPGAAHKSFSDRTDLYQEITDKIIRELEQGRLPWVQPWSAKGSAQPGVAKAPLGLPRNAATGRPYSGINVLLLWCAVEERGFTVQSWLTFRQALKLDAHVKKGEKGTTLFYADRFIPHRERLRAAENGDEPEAIPFLKRFTVFNVDQIEDLPAGLAAAPEPVAENLILPRPRISSARPGPISASAATAPFMSPAPIIFRSRRLRLSLNRSTFTGPSRMSLATGVSQA